MSSTVGAGAAAEAMRTIRAASPETRIVAHLTSLDADVIEPMFQAGAIAYVTQSCSDEELASAVVSAAGGRAFLSREATGNLWPRAVEASVRFTESRRELDELKRQLLTILTHELLTPVTILQGVAQTMADRKNLGPDELEGLSAASQRASTKLARLMANLTTATRLESGDVRLQATTVAVSDLVASVVGQFRGEPRLRVVGNVPDDASVRVDGPLGTRAVAAVIENCLDISDPDADVDLSATTTDRGVELRVFDRGPGVPEHLRQRIFELFSQADSRDIRPFRGAGIGLYVARRIVELHGGLIEVHPRGGGGSVFVIAFPRALGAEIRQRDDT